MFVMRASVFCWAALQAIVLSSHVLANQAAAPGGARGTASRLWKRQASGAFKTCIVAGTDATPPTEGKCIPLQLCAQFLSFLSGPNPDKSYIRSAICKFAQGTAYVCCPDAPPTEEIDARTADAFPSAGDGNCGIFVADKIVGGTQAPPGSWPWMALIFFISPRSRTPKPLCGGSLINKDFVLTAAHCTSFGKHKLAYVRLGENDLMKDPDCPDFGSCQQIGPVVDAKVKRIITHPDYTGQFENDIALLQLEEPIDFENVGTNILPCCLPFDMRDVSGDRDGSLAGMNATVAGWGRIGPSMTAPGSDVLQQLIVPILSSEECQKIAFGGYKQEDHICAGGESGKNSCSGDSGGPLVVSGTGHSANIFYQVGVVSFGDAFCGSAGVPGFYTRVTRYLDWIKTEVERASTD